ncbi:MAG: type IV pilus assembly protein PilM [Actinomycetota bacterium]|jgi:type IV pilus assembly protein PilM|nr:type IV pilus assembly protein PilM [Actinomycetota bacterium]MDA8314807.1 type IV pilus assembly protein PilM [Actinomycetota bacterium]
MGERIVGLDIGTSALRAVELIVEDGRPPVLEAFGQVGLPPGIIVDGEIRDRAQVTSAIRRLWRHGGFKTNRVRLGVAGLRAITREIELPPVPPDEVAAAVALQAEDIVPFPIERTSVASAVISRTEDAEGLPLIRVLVAAAHRDLVDSLVAVVEEAGLEPEGIDLDTAALSRAFTLPDGATEPEAVVSVGAGLTMVVVRHGGTLQFVRTIDMGGDTVTRALASALDIPIADAEILKRRLALPGAHDPAAKRAVSDVVEQLADEVKSSLRFFGTLPGRTPPSRVLVTGGGARTVGLLEQLRLLIDVPVLEASPLSLVDASGIHVSASEADSINQTVAVPIGLALNGPARTRFELIPPEVAARRAARRRKRQLSIALAGLVVALGAVSAWRVLAVRNAQREVQVLQSTIHTVNTVEMPRYDKAVRLGDQVTTLEHQLAPLVSHEVDWLVVLNQLGEYLPPSAVLNGVDLTATTPTGGAATTTTAHLGSSVIGTGTTTVFTHTLTQVTQFGLAMAGSPALAAVDLSGGVSAATTGVTFPVTFSITSAAHGQRLGQFEERIP